MMKMSERRYRPVDYRYFPNKDEPWEHFKKWILGNTNYDFVDPDVVELVKALNEKASLVTFWSCFGHYGNRLEVDLWCRDKKAGSSLKNIFDKFAMEKLHFSLDEYPSYYSRFFIEGSDEEKRQIMRRVICKLKNQQ